MGSADVVVVTGASSGFGRLMAETFARGGYRVFASMREPGGRNAPVARALEARADREGVFLRPLEIDVTDEDSIGRAIAAVLDSCGRVDVLVNNAGYAVLDLLETVPADQAQELFDTNFFGALRMDRAVLPAMKRQGAGLLVHVSSGAGRLAIPAMGMYCASKFALEAMAEVYRYELASLGIDSVIVEPGAYPTAIAAKFQRGRDPGRREGYGPVADLPASLAATIAASQADPQEVADCVLRIVEAPAGRRPLRHRVPAGGTAVLRINALTDEVQAQVLESFGMSAIAKFRGP